MSNMQPIQTLINPAINTKPCSSITSNKQNQPLEKAHSTTSTGSSKARELAVLHIWSVLGRVFGHTWSSQHIGDEIDKKIWGEAIEGLTPAMVKAGLSQVIRSEMQFPPKPGVFRSLCLDRDEADVEKLYQEVIHWSSLSEEERSREALFIVRTIDMYAFKRANHREARALFEKGLSALDAHLASGGELPEIPLAIENRASAPKAKNLPERIRKLAELLTLQEENGETIDI